MGDAFGNSIGLGNHRVNVTTNHLNLILILNNVRNRAPLIAQMIAARCSTTGPELRHVNVKTREKSITQRLRYDKIRVLED